MAPSCGARPAVAITVEMQEEFCGMPLSHCESHAAGLSEENFWGWKREETSSMSDQVGTHAHMKKVEHISELMRGLTQESAELYRNTPPVSDYSHDCSRQNQVDDFFCITVNDPVGNIPGDLSSTCVESLQKKELAYSQEDEGMLDSSEGDSHCNASTFDSEDGSSKSATSPTRERDLDATDYFACDSDSSCEMQRESSGMPKQILLVVSATASLNEHSGDIVPEGIWECASTYLQSISACFPMASVGMQRDPDKDHPSRTTISPRSVARRGNGLPRILLRAVGFLASILCIITIAQVVLNELINLKDFRENLVMY